MKRRWSSYKIISAHLHLSNKQNKRFRSSDKKEAKIRTNPKINEMLTNIINTQLRCSRAYSSLTVARNEKRMVLYILSCCFKFSVINYVMCVYDSMCVCVCIVCVCVCVLLLLLVMTKCIFLSVYLSNFTFAERTQFYLTAITYPV